MYMHVTCMCVCMHVTKYNEKRGYEFERRQEGVYERFGGGKMI